MQKLGAISRRKLRELRLDLCGEGDDIGVLAARADGISQRAQVWASVTGEVRVGHIRGVEHGLDGQKLEWRECRTLLVGESRFPEPASLRKERMRELQHRQLGHRVLLVRAR